MTLPVGRYLILSLLILTNTLVLAQRSSDTTQIETLFGKNLAAKGYGGVQVGFSSLNDASVFILMAEGGLIVNKKVNVGIELSGIVSSAEAEVYYDRYDDEVPAVIRGFYGGIKIEPALKPKKVVHLTFPVVIGGGKLFYKTDRTYVTGASNSKRLEIDSDAFFYIEPGIRGEVNLSRFIRFGLGVQYRITSVDLNSTPSDSFQGIVTKIGFTFGKF
jgi:hypothetical protein